MTLIVGDNLEHFGKFRHPEPQVFFGFGSVAALADYVESIPVNSACDHPWSTDPDKRQWTGTVSMHAAISTARNGWQAGQDMALDVLARMTAPKPMTRARAHGIAGGSVNVGRMLAGNPVHMRTRVPMPARKIITLFVELSFSSAISAEKIIMRATMIAAACDRLEQAGYSCEIVALVTITTDTVDGKDCAYQAAVTVKTAGQRASLQDIVFGIGHPSMFRRFMFALVVDRPDLRRIWQNQGYPASAFNAVHTPARESYYFRSVQVSDKIKDDVDAIFRHVVPKDLQIVLDNAG